MQRTTTTEITGRNRMARAQLIEEDGMFGVTLPDGLTDEQWQRLHGSLIARGYDFLSVADVRKTFQHITGDKPFVHPAHKHWVDSLIYVLGLTVEPRISPVAKSALDKALQEWGVTNDPRKGGFILTDGSFLDMSQGGPERCLVHHDIEKFFPKFHPNPLNVVEEWKDLGLIRWISEGKGVSMRTLPTSSQFSTIRKLVTFRSDKLFHMDVHDPRFKGSNRSYPPGISAEKIVIDITHFYETGVLGAMSAVMNFHCWATTDSRP